MNPRRQFVNTLYAAFRDAFPDVRIHVKDRPEIGVEVTVQDIRVVHGNEVLPELISPICTVQQEVIEVLVDDMSQYLFPKV